MERSSLTECWVGLVFSPQFRAHLPNRLHERQRFDIAHGTADLHQADIGVAGAGDHAVLDLVGNVGNHLHGRPEILAPALLRDDISVDPARGEIAVAGRGRANEALVVTEIEIGLGPVLGDENLAMLERTHGARIHVDIGIQLDHADLESAGLQYCAQGRGRDALSK